MSDPNNVKHVVCMPWHDRVNYLRIALATMDEAARGRDDVQVVVYRNNNDEPAPAIVQDTKWLRVAVKDLPTTNCHYNYINMMRDAFDTFDVDHVFTQDADAIIHPRYFDMADTALDRLDDLGLFSFFNDDCVPESHEVVKDVFHRRPHISFFSTFIMRRAWDAFPKPAPNEQLTAGCMDGHLSLWVANESEYGVYSSICSHAEHLGYGGTHAGGGPGKEVFVRGRRFYA